MKSYTALLLLLSMNLSAQKQTPKAKAQIVEQIPLASLLESRQPNITTSVDTPVQSKKELNKTSKVEAVKTGSQAKESRLACNNWLSTPVYPSNVSVGDIDVVGNQLTVEALVNRRSDFDQTVDFGKIVSKHTDASNVNYSLMQITCEITTTRGYINTPVVCPPDYDRTYHVAMVYDGNQLKFYRNGFLMTAVFWSGDLVNTDLLTTIGSGPDNPSPLFQSHGNINEVRIWNVARSQSDIRQYMGGGLPNPSTQTGLLAYYTFDNLINKQGNPAFDGTLGGSATINNVNPNCNFIPDSCAVNIPLPVGCSSALEFQKSRNATVKIEPIAPAKYNDLYPTTGFTWESWFRLNRPISNLGLLLSTQDAAPARDILLGFGRGATPNALSFLVSNNGSPTAATVAVETIQPLTIGTWYHVSAVCDYNSAILRLYLNGTLVGSQIIPPDILNNKLIDNISTQIGNASSALTSSLDATIDEVRFWNTVRSEAQILANMNTCLPASQPGLVAYYHADEQAGMLVGSAVNNSFPGNYTNPLWGEQVTNINCTPTPICTVSAASCISTTATITVNSPIGTNYEYSLNGGAFQASNIFNGVGVGTYQVTVKNTTLSCASFPATVLVSTLTTPTTPVIANLIQPSCTVASGSFSISAPLGNDLEYSLDGVNYQTSANFTNLAAGNYTVTARNRTSLCVSSSTPVIINNRPPAPAAATIANLIQPSCTIASGSFSISAPLGSDLEYSIDGVNYQASPNFTGLNAGNYNITVRFRISLCISSQTPITINPRPTIPATPTIINLLHPTCTTAGSFSVALPLANNLEYSIDGINYQTSPTFAGLVSGNYSLTVRNRQSLCSSNTTPVTINAIPANPPTPTITNLTQPGCARLVGAFNVSTPLGADFSYSIDGTNFQTSTSFSSLTPGNYNLIVRSTATNCRSSVLPITINASPLPPNRPTALVTATPNCTVPTGGFSITSPTGNNFVYSINGNSFQSLVNYANLNRGVYKIVAKDLLTNCVSDTFQLAIGFDSTATSKYLMPNAFSPNNDGINDCFRIKNWGVITELQFMIFNRWGEMVFATNNPNACWDGRYKNIPQPAEVFVYYIRAKTLCGTIERKSHFQLVR
jgi:gliding motility-associated-like protein